MSPSLPTSPPVLLADKPAVIETSVREAARSAIGVKGQTQIPRWREAVPRSGRRRVLALGLINASFSLPLTTLLLLLPLVARDTKSSTTLYGGTLIASAILAALLGLPLSDRVPPAKRVAAAIVLSINAALLALLANLIPGIVIFLVIGLGRGTLFGLSAPIIRTLAFDATVPEARARTLARTHIGTLLGAAAGGLCAWLATTALNIGVGQALVVAGVLGVILSLGSFLLTDTAVGGFEPNRIRRALGKVHDPVFELRPTWAESIVRISSIPTLRFSLTAYVAVGWCTSAALIIPIVRLAKAKDLYISTPALVIAISSLVSALILLLASRGLEKTHQKSPEGLAAVISLGLILAFAGILLTGLLPKIISPQLALAGIGAYLAWVALDITVFSALQPEDRAAAAGLSVFSLIGGGLVGLLLISAVSALINSSTGYVIAFAAASLPVLLFWRRSKKLIRAAGPDLDARLGVDEDSQSFDEGVSESGQAPILSARNVDFAYGSVQVLFDVSMRVNEGEMVALLGPNGVGKTTLLRVLSGLEKPQGGVVRLAGENVTDLGASRRVTLGLSQIVGGNAVFGSMTVYENLTMYGFSLGRDRASVKAGIEEAFEIFPKIADRRNQLGSTLSGGEQQMLGLSKALITKPKVLVVDEFSLGLAPIVVGELLGMVRELNSRGTAILVVEQSVNVALNLVDRCYFMEKGEIVYEGLSKDLLAQPDLVQTLSLGGVPEKDSPSGPGNDLSTTKADADSKGNYIS